MFTIAALYHFTRFADAAALRVPLLELCRETGLKGTLILAGEGINGTVAGTRAGVDTVLAYLRSLPGCAGLDHKESTAREMPFGRIKVLVKREIVTMGRPDVDPCARVGAYIDPRDWNALISAPDVAVIDTRNAYEVAIGSFRGAVDPGTQSFGAFPSWWAANRERFAGKRIAMFCTGGIRCEKATSWLLGQGVPEVYHLRGGILRYLEVVPETQSLWDGECFVFDGRVSVGHGLREGTDRMCHACRRPLMPADLGRTEYEMGVVCHHCKDEYDEADRARFRERQRQYDRASRRTAGREDS